MTFLVDPGISQKNEGLSSSRTATLNAGTVEFVERLIFQGSPLCPLATEFIYPCSHLSHAGTEQLKMPGEMQLSIFFCLHCYAWSKLSSLSVCLGHGLLPLSRWLPTWWHRDRLGCELSAGRWILAIRSPFVKPKYLPVKPEEPPPVPPAVPTRMHGEPFRGRVTVGPLPTYYTASESAI